MRRMVTRCIAYLAVLAAMFVSIETTEMVSKTSKDEHITVITGSKHIARVGTLEAPPNFLSGAYNMNWTAYIFILENVATHGSVQVDIDIFDLHPNSWLTVRKSKYSGYLGRVSDRYNSTHPPVSMILTDTCCLRIEFQTGCCGTAIAGKTGRREFFGVRAQYEFVPTLYQGRRVECTEDPKYPKLCNGECLPTQFDCPCSKFGRYKCANEMCIPRDLICDGLDDCGDQSDETDCKVITPRREVIRMLGMYSLGPIVISCGGIILLGFCMACVFSVLDTRMRWICTVIIETTAQESGFASSSWIKSNPSGHPGVGHATSDSKDDVSPLSSAFFNHRITNPSRIRSHTVTSLASMINHKDKIKPFRFQKQAQLRRMVQGNGRGKLSSIVAQGGRRTWIPKRHVTLHAKRAPPGRCCSQHDKISMGDTGSYDAAKLRGNDTNRNAIPYRGGIRNHGSTVLPTMSRQNLSNATRADIGMNSRSIIRRYGTGDRRTPCTDDRQQSRLSRGHDPSRRATAPWRRATAPHKCSADYGNNSQISPIPDDCTTTHTQSSARSMGSHRYKARTHNTSPGPSTVQSRIDIKSDRISTSQDSSMTARTNDIYVDVIKPDGNLNRVMNDAHNHDDVTIMGRNLHHVMSDGDNHGDVVMQVGSLNHVMNDGNNPNAVMLNSGR